MSTNQLKAAIINELIRSRDAIIFFSDSEKLFGVSAQQLGDAGWELHQEDVVYMTAIVAAPKQMEETKHKLYRRKARSSEERYWYHGYVYYSYMTLIN